MRQQLLAISITCLALGAYGQQKALKVPADKDIAVPNYKHAISGQEAVPQMALNPQPYRPQVKSVSQVVIGETLYDLQSNSALQNRTVYYPDGTTGAAFTKGDTESAFDDRGTGYNYHDGAGWGPMPTSRIETTRNGWPSLMLTSAGSEIVVSHSGTGGFTMNKRSPKGSGTWAETIIPTNTGHDFLWPRAVAGGADGNSIHCIGITTPVGNNGTPYQGIDGALLYWRSTDEGSTWDMVDVLIPDLDSTHFNATRADTYTIIADGDNVAIAVFNQWADMILLKSSDNGSTWTSQLVNDFPLDLYVTDQGSDVDGDLIADTISTCDEAGSIIFDDQGMIHMTFGHMRVLDADLTDENTTYFPLTQELYYWNESMGTGNFTTIAVPEDVNQDGTLDYAGAFVLYYVSLCSQPSMGMSADGTIFVAYASYREDLFTVDQNFRHVYLLKSADGGTTWSDPFDATPDPQFYGYECVFPTMAPQVDDKVRLTYMRDFEPGLAVRGDNDFYDLNEIMFLCADTTFIYNVGVDELFQDGISVQLHPNPAMGGEVTVDMTLPSSQLVAIAVTDVNGREVAFVQENLAEGDQSVVIDTHGFKSGVYFVTALINGKKVVKELIVEN